MMVHAVTCRVTDFLRELDARVALPSRPLLTRDAVASGLPHLFIPGHGHISGELQGKMLIMQADAGSRKLE